MAIFKVRVTLADGRRARLVGLFTSGAAAIVQALCDFPDARSVSALCVSRARGSA